MTPSGYDKATPPAKIPRKFPDGLHFFEHDVAGIRWWCRFCHGNRRHMRGLVADDRELAEAWGAHKASSTHQAEVEARRLADSVARHLDP